MTRSQVSLFILCVFSSLSFAVSMNFTGNWRTRASNYGGLSLSSSGEQTKAFIGSRFLLEPNVVIDDHFSVKGQWSLLNSPTLAPDSTQQLGAGSGDYILGDQDSVGMVGQRAWVEWMSDFGVMRVGRMPVAWGYGLVYDAGANIWDDWQSTFDRLEYRLHLGNVIGALAYTKGDKFSTLGNVNDQEFYSIYLQYTNAESETEAGVLYEKQTRSKGQQLELWNGTTKTPYAWPTSWSAGATKPGIATKMPYPLDNHVVDLYIKKTIGYFQFGGEVTWIGGTAVDYSAGGVGTTTDNLNALGAMASVTYEYHKIKAFLEILYAQGDNNLNNDENTAFMLFHRNRSPGLILGRELLGAYYGKETGGGHPFAYGNADVFTGVISVRPGIKIDWTTALSSGAEIIIMQKAATAAGEAAFLGVEIDVGTKYEMYKNFDVGLNLGYLVPGAGLGVASPRGAFAFQGTAALKF